MNKIERDVYVLVNTYKEPIELTQGTSGIPVIFCFRDYDIPEETTASIFVRKPSGKEILDAAVVDSSNDTVTIDLTEQMTAEVGEAIFQVQLSHNEKNIYTFNHPAIVEKSASNIDSESGSNILDKYLEDMEEAVEQAEVIKQNAEAGVYSASITIGEVTTGAPGTEAEVTNVGTEKDVILNFLIPKGESGVMAPTSGMFSLYLDPASGDLYVEYPDGSEPPVFELEDNGDLYFVTDEGGVTL